MAGHVCCAVRRVSKHFDSWQHWHIKSLELVLANTQSCGIQLYNNSVTAHRQVQHAATNGCKNIMRRCRIHTWQPPIAVCLTNTHASPLSVCLSIHIQAAAARYVISQTGTRPEESGEVSSIATSRSSAESRQQEGKGNPTE